MADERVRRSRIVGYWRAVELFSPQKIPAVSARDRVYAVTADSPLPWEAGHALRSVPLDTGFVWQHVVYGGAYALRAVRDTLLQVFGEREEDHDGRMDGESALFALTVTDEGRLLLDSPVLSTCAWATGRATGSGTASTNSRTRMRRPRRAGIAVAAATPGSTANAVWRTSCAAPSRHRTAECGARPRNASARRSPTSSGCATSGRPPRSRCATYPPRRPVCSRPSRLRTVPLRGCGSAAPWCPVPSRP